MVARWHLGRLWSQFIYDYPVPVFVISILLTSVLPLISLYFNRVLLSENAEVGFDTSNTEYSGQRQAWKKLSYILQSTNRVQLGQTNSSSNTTVVSRKRRDLSLADEYFPDDQFISTTDLTSRIEAIQKSQISRIRRRRGWTENLVSAFTNVPCYEAPLPLMNHLSQLVVEVPGYEAIWDLSFLKKLCGLHHGIADAVKPFESYTPYRNVYSLANSFACLSPNFLVNCTELTPADVNVVRNLVDFCLPHRRKIIDCRLTCGDNCTDSSCPEIPQNCSTAMMSDLFYRILPTNIHARPLYVNTFLPVFTRMGYATQNIWLPLVHYDQLEVAITNYTSTVGLEMKGLLMELKRDRLLSAAIKDSFYSFLAAFLVMFCVALHSRSVLFSVAVQVQLLLSVLCALSIYALFTPDFPLLNLVIFVLLIAVGSDDAFLLHSHFPEQLNEENFHEALAHTASTMFLTSASTAVPFFVNIWSNVIVFRCFGLFAGLTMIINFLLVISYLPAYLIIQKRYFSCLPKLPDVSRFCSSSLKVVFPQVLIQGRLLWLASLSMLVVSCFYVTLQYFSLPKYNPLQLFRADNPHEWYDNHAQPLFEFVEAKIAIPLHARLVWGIKPVQQPAMFRELTDPPLQDDRSFSMATVPDVKKLARTLARIRALPFVEHPHPYWPEQFLSWSNRYVCNDGLLCCNISSPLFTNSYLDYCLRNSTSYIFTQYNDTPIFDANDFRLIGYTALLPTKLRYAHVFKNLSMSFAQFDDGLRLENGGWYTTEWYLMSTWFDLQRSIVIDCKSSVIISLIVVSLMALAVLRWQAFACLLCICAIIIVSVGVVVLLGWVLGVLEAVILVLIVGLSFDFTLHFGASLPPIGCPNHRVEKASILSVAPVSLAALSSIIAGVPMLLCKTHAFFQVGVFLVVSMSVSWLFANFFFLPLLTFTLSRRQKCDLCDQKDFQMVPKF
ncbi:unnamed protein product, partial [Mesorhabditis belari]|uniref:SSD domain-containing protein n=1 Tax=Mesorhabditis belari TaxID=2138241 RepID=A0AAF3J6M3_9BILA